MYKTNERHIVLVPYGKILGEISVLGQSKNAFLYKSNYIALQR